MKQDNKWWTFKDAKRIGETVFSCVQTIRKRQNYRTLNNVQNLRLYGNIESFYPNVVSMFKNQNKETLKWNVIRSATDTLHSKITKNKPRPMFLTERGNYEKKEQALMLQDFIDGQFYKMDMYDTGSKAALGSYILGDGFIKIWNDTEQIHTEYVLSEEMVVDDTDGILGDPKTLYQVRPILRDVLHDLFPDQYDAIASAKPLALDFSIYSDLADMVEIIEAWRLPTNKEGTNGKRALCLSSIALEFDDYKRKQFPFVKLPYNPLLYGYYSQSVADITKQIQISMNRHLIKLEKSLNLFESPRVWVEMGSKVNTKNFTNEPGMIGYYKGVPPVIDSARIVSPEVYNHIENLYNKAFQAVGISALSASSIKPAGLNSGEAQRVYQDIETERFALTAQRYDKMYLDLTEHVIYNAKEIAEKGNGKNLIVKGLSDSSFKKIDWTKIKLKEEDYAIQVYPTNMLPKEPAGRIAKVTEMLNSGMMDPITGMKLLDYPDVKAFTSVMYAGQDAIEKVATAMIVDKQYIPPEPFQDIAYSKSYMQNMYLRLKADSAPEQVLELFRNYLADLKAMEDQLIQDQMAAQMQAQMQAQPLPPTMAEEALPPGTGEVLPV